MNNDNETSKGKRVIKNLSEIGKEHFLHQWKEEWVKVSKSLNSPRPIDPGLFFCRKCDPNAKQPDPKGIELTKRMLDKQIKFRKDPHHDKGKFVYERAYKSEYINLPLGYHNCVKWQEKIDAKLHKLPNSNIELNHRLNDDYINKRIVWYNDYRG